MKNILILICLATVFLFLPGNSYGYEKFHGAHPGLKVNYDSMFQAAQPLESSTIAQDLIDNCLQAYGGSDHLSKLQSVRYKWMMKTLKQQDSIEVIKTYQHYRKYRIEKHNSWGTENRILNGNQAWFQGVDTLIPLDKSRYKAEFFSYLVMSMPLALTTESFNQIKYNFREADSLHHIYMEKSDSLLIIIGINPKTYYIEKVEGVILEGDNNFVFINHFADFKKTDGYVFPNKMTNVSMGLTVGESVLREVEVNYKAQESYFNPENSYKNSY